MARLWHAWDVIGAHAAGLDAAWIRRSEAQVFDPWGIEPTLIVASLNELADRLAQDRANSSSHPPPQRATTPIKEAGHVRVTRRLDEASVLANRDRIPPDGGGEWFCGGDLAHLDDDGYVWFHGRDDDILNPMGYRLSPLEIEGVLADHPMVHEVAVGEVAVSPEVKILAAFIPHGRGDETELLDWAKRHLAAYKLPRRVVFVDHLPRTRNGKLRRRELPRSLSGG